jgi:hypothetical protein
MTHADPDELAKSAAIDFARQLVRRWQEALGTELLGGYLIGSLAHAGFSRRYSDIDIALVTTAGLAPQALDHLRDEAVALSTHWGPRFQCSGPTGTSLWADFRHWIGSTISTTRLL